MEPSLVLMSHKQMYILKIGNKFTSQVTGTVVGIGDVLVYDLMPKILGSRFMDVESLRENAHFFGANGLYNSLDLAGAYTILSDKELCRGNQECALELYKRSLYNKMCFTRAVVDNKGDALVTASLLKMIKENDKSTSLLEKKLSEAVALMDIGFNYFGYLKFVEDIRRLEAKALQLDELYFSGEVNPSSGSTYKKGDSEIGRELREVYAEMHLFRAAALMSANIRDCAGRDKYTKLAKKQEEEHPELKQTLNKIKENLK